ncbi:MAG: winged helix-turn-helix domain-containing protein [Candidatus Solibacter sp.]
MGQTGQSPRIIRFGTFEVDLDAAELRKQGLRLRLQEQPFQVLTALLENPGQVVAREDLIRRLWADGTVVDFDRGLNAAVTRLRQVLSDSAETPRYVETVARRGYRFVAAIEVPAIDIAANDVTANDGPPEPALSPPVPLPLAATLQRSTWLLTACALLAILGIAAWLVFRGGQPPSGDTRYNVITLTSEPGFEHHPSFSPDASQIAFEWDQGTGVPHIFVKVTGTGDPVRLTSSSDAEYGPAWSRDGRYIAFLRTRNADAMGVWVIPAVGGVERKVAEFVPNLWVMRHQLRRMDWMPDSRHIVVSGAERRGSNERLFLVDTAAGEIAWLTPTRGGDLLGDREPAVSPDGKTIAFTRGLLSISQQLHVLPLSASMQPVGEARKLVDSRSVNPFWTRDGSEIVFVYGQRLARIGLQSGAVPREITGLSDMTTPVLSQSGRLAFSRETQDTNIWRQEIPAAGSTAPPPQRLIASTANDQDARYSPDGSRIVFQSTRSGWIEIWACGSDGAHCAQITNVNRRFITGTPRWSPDSKWIAYDSAWEGRFHIYVTSAGGGASRRLTPESDGGAIPSWSQDGKWVYYVTTTNGRGEIWKVPVVGGAPVQVTRAGGLTAFEDTSGTSLYYTKDEVDPTLWQSALDGSGEREVLRGVSHRGFVPAGDTIYYLRDESPTEISIRRFKRSTHEDSRISSITKPTYLGLSLSPDGRYLIYSQIDEQGADLMFVENFR